MSFRNLALLVALLLGASCNPFPQKRGIPSINVNPIPACIGQSAKLSGVLFPSDTITLYVVSPPAEERIRLGEVRPNSQGEWELDIQVDPKWVRPNATDSNFRLLLITATFDGSIINQSMPVMDCSN